MCIDPDRAASELLNGHVVVYEANDEILSDLQILLSRDSWNKMGEMCAIIFESLLGVFFFKLAGSLFAEGDSDLFQGDLQIAVEKSMPESFFESVYLSLQPM